MPLMTLDLPPQLMTQLVMPVPDEVVRVMDCPETGPDIVQAAEEFAAPVAESPETVPPPNETAVPERESRTFISAVDEPRRSEIRSEAARIVRDIRAHVRSSMKVPVSQAKKSELEAAAVIIVSGIRTRIKLAQLEKDQQRPEDPGPSQHTEPLT